jgi:hypothetical protein
MTVTHDIRPGDVYVDQHGLGKLVAEVEAATDTTVRLVRKQRTRTGRYVERVKFDLPVWFLKSRACGWAEPGAQPRDKHEPVKPRRTTTMTLVEFMQAFGKREHDTEPYRGSRVSIVPGPTWPG